MGPPPVIPTDPMVDGFASVSKVREVVLPGAFFLEAPEKALDQPVLLGCIRSNELLCQTVGTASPPEPLALEDQTVVTTDDRAVLWNTESAKTLQTSFLQGSLRFLGSAPEGELITQELAVVTIDDCTEVTPTVFTARDVRDIHGPTNIALLSPASPGSGSWPGCPGSLVNEPPFDFHDSIDCFSVYLYSLVKSEDRPNPSIAESRVIIDDRLDFLSEFQIDA